MLNYGIPPEFRGGVHLFIYNRHTPSGQSRVYRVTQMRTDGVHCRESAGTGPVNLNVVPNECCLSRSPRTKFIFASLSHTHYWYEVGMLKVLLIAVYTILIPSSHHATIGAWVDIKMSGSDPPLHCSFKLITMQGHQHTTTTKGTIS